MSPMMARNRNDFPGFPRVSGDEPGLDSDVENIKAILDQSGIVELQRSQLADTFQVVPSQINSVIKTRFTESRGYLVESKRVLIT